MVLGVIEYRRVRYEPAGGAVRGMALAGTICGGVNLLLAAGLMTADAVLA